MSNSFEIISDLDNTNNKTENTFNQTIVDGDSLYEIRKLAIFEHYNGSPTQIKTILSNERLYVIIDNSLRIFENRSCNKIIHQQIFERYIDCLTIFSNNQYIVICLRNGMIHVINNDSKFELIHSVKLPNLIETCDEEVFIDCLQEDDTNLFLITKPGGIYRLSIDSTSINGKFQMNISLFQQFDSIKSASLQYPTLIVNSKKLSIINLNNYTDTIEGWSFRKIRGFNNLFLGLDFYGKFSIICPITLTIFPINNQIEYNNFELINDSNNNHCLIIATTKSNDDDDDDDRNFYLHTLQYPEFQIVHKFKITTEIYLTKLENLNDDLMYITHYFDDNQQMNKINICEIIETEPKDRLKRLLIKNKFYEAEQYAIQHSISLEIVNRTKCEVISYHECDHNNIDELIQLFDKIDDIEFILKCSKELTYKYIDDMEKILNYVIAKKTKRTFERKNVELLRKQFIDKLYKFNIFKLIYKGDDFTQDKWEIFTFTPLLTTLETLLDKKLIEEAAILYRQLDHFTIDNLNNSQIIRILNIINQQSVSDCQAFLFTFIPVTLKHLPSVMPLFIEWIKMKVFAFEREDLYNFPTNAIGFINKISKLFQFNDNNTNDLTNLLIILEKLQLFKKNYNLIIPLNIYLSFQTPKDEIKYLLNIQINIENYNRIVCEIILNLIVENHLNVDDIFHDEITNMMKYCNDYWIARIKLLLNWINNLDKKLQTIQNILDLAKIPYSNEIKQIAQDSLVYSQHSIVDEIRQLLNDEPIRIVLNRCEYDFVEKEFDGIDDLRFFVNRIIFCNLPTMMDDIKILCRTPQYLFEANILIIKNYLRKRDLESAIAVFNNIAKDEMLQYVRYFFTFAETELQCPKFYYNFFEILWSIYNRCEFKNKCHQNYYYYLYNQFKSIYNLYRKFDIKLTLSEWKRNRIEIFNNLIDNLLITNLNNINELFDRCNEISQIFSMSFDEILIKICTKLDDINMIIVAGELLSKQNDNCRDLCLMCVLLLNTITSTNIRLDNTTLFDESIYLPSNNDIPTNISYKALELANRLISKALIHAQSDEIQLCLEISNWTNIVYYINSNNEQNNLNKIVFGDVVCCDTIVATNLTYKTIENVFNLYCDFVHRSNYPNRYILHFQNNSIDSQTDLNRQLIFQLNNINTLIRQGQFSSSYQLMNVLYQSLIKICNVDSQIIDNLKNSLLKTSIPSLIRFELQKNNFNIYLIQSLILCLDIDSGREILKNSLKLYKRTPSKLHMLSLISYQLHDYLKINPNELIQTMLTIKWWNKFNKHLFNYDEFFKCSNDYRLQLIFDHVSNINIELIQNYCKDFKLNPQIYYQKLLIKILTQWKPNYQIVNHQLIINNSYEDLLEECLKVVDVIDDKTVIAGIIKDQWNSINFYYYEVFLVMIHLLSSYQHNSDIDKKLSALIFLKNYQRHNEPSDNEIESWFTTFPDKQILDVLSQFRLPFINALFTECIWNIIRPEITLKTYKLWFQCICIWNKYLNQDEICCFAIKNIVSSGLLTNDTNDKWILYPKYQNLFTEIDECVQHITDLEKSTSVLYYLLSHTPNGADKVNAAKLCYQYALKYKNMQPHDLNIEKAFTKVEMKFFNFSTTHILYLNKLNPDNYTNYLNKPEELIRKLYKDNRIVELSNNSNINATIEDLAQLFNLQITELRKKIVYNWIFNSQNTSFIDDDDANDDNDHDFKRIVYICKSNTIRWSDDLYKIAMLESNSFTVRAKALKLLQFVSNTKSIEEKTKLTFDEFKILIRKFNLLDNLQYLGYNFELETLDKYNKNNLLTQLAKRPHEYCIKTMAIVCMTYTIYDTKYWKFIIENAIEWSTISELKTYVEFLKNNTKCVIKPFYVQAWQRIIDQLFVQIMDIPQEKLNNLLIDNFLMIQSCPVLSSINFETVFHRCIQLGTTTFASLLLPYLNEKKEDFAKEIINNNTNIIKDLDELIGCGLWGISKAKTILNNNI